MVFPNLTAESADVWGTSIRSGTDTSLCALTPIHADFSRTFIIALASGVAVAVSNYALMRATAKLGCRMRTLTFKATLRQDSKSPIIHISYTSI
jgi:hypothetical protein